MSRNVATSHDQHTAQAPFYGPKRFSGTISLNEQRVSCSLTAEIGRNGILRISLDDVPIDDRSWFLFEASDPGSRFIQYTLEAMSEDGDQLRSDQLFFDKPGHKSNDTGSYFRFSGQCNTAKFVIKNPKPVTGGRITYWLRGFRSFRPLRFGTPFGELVMRGIDRDDTANIGGVLQLSTTSEAVSNENPRKEIIEFFEHVLWIMSFASGTLLKDPVRAFEYDDVAELDVRGLSESPPPIFPPFYYMHLQPIFERAVSSYFDRRSECKDLRIVFEWLLMAANYTDARLLALAISFEHLANKMLIEEERRVIDQKKFENIRDDLYSILSASTMHLDDQKMVKSAFAKSNQLSFREKLGKLINKYQIPMQDLPSNVLKKIINIRHTIAHGGSARGAAEAESTDLSELMLLAREVMTRIILSRIGFTGQYCSFVGGLHTRSFPSCERLS